MDDQHRPEIPAPYTGPNVTGGMEEIFVQDGFAEDDPRLWVPLSPEMWESLRRGNRLAIGFNDHSATYSLRGLQAAERAIETR